MQIHGAVDLRPAFAFLPVAAGSKLLIINRKT
jgi:hypothetical protein